MYKEYVTSLTFQAVQDGKIDTVEQWLTYNKSQPSRNHYSDKHGLYPIHYAAKFNQPKIMKLLCNDGKAGRDQLVQWEIFMGQNFCKSAKSKLDFMGGNFYGLVTCWSRM